MSTTTPFAPFDPVDISDVGVPERGPSVVLTVAPRMERPKEHHEVLVPTGAGWHNAMTRLLKVTRISPAACSDRTRRVTRKGDRLEPLQAKDCAPGVLAYRLPEGVARGSAWSQMDEWTWLFHDLDKVPMAVDDLVSLVERALPDVKHATSTTHSCRDGDARLRILTPLSRTCSYAEVCDIWWRVRDRLIAAGLPAVSIEPGEPTVDSRFDPKVFYLAAVPTPQEPGVEGWGGTMPKGAISADAVPVLDVDQVLGEARAIRAREEPEHLTQFPGVPVPGGRGGAASGAVTSRDRESRGAAEETEWEDWATVPFAGTNLRAWATANLPPGTERSVGSPWRDDGGSGLSGKSLRVHRREDGTLWAYDFPRNTVHVDAHDDGIGVFGEVTLEGSKKWGTTSINLYREDGGGAPLSSTSNADSAEKADPELTGQEFVASFVASGGSLVRWGVPDLLDGVYLPDLPLTRRVTYLRAPHGRGKTERTKGIVEAITNLGASMTAGRDRGPIVSVVHRRTLARQQSSRLGLPSYEDVSGELAGDVVVCLDSLRRVPLHHIDGEGVPVPVHPRLVILDEADQVIHHLFGGTLSGPASVEAAERLRTLLKNAEQVLVMSADVDVAAVKMIRLLMGLDAEKGDPANEELRVLAVALDRVVRLDVDTARTDRDLFAEWAEGKRLAVHAQSRRECGRIARQLTEARPDARVLLITSETVSTPEVSAFLDDPSRASSYDAIVYSPSLGTGYSVDVRDHFHRVYGYSRVGVGTVTDLVQGLMRVRHPVESEVRVCCPKGGATVRETDPTRIYDALVTLGDATVRIIGPDGHPVRTTAHVVGTEALDDDGVVKIDPWRTWHTRLFARVLSRERRLGGPGGARHRAFLAYLRGVGAKATVTEPLDADEAKGIKAEAKEARAEVRQERAERVASAEVITVADARKVVEAKDQAEADSVERAYVEDFYGDADVDTVLADDEGKLRGEARNFARMVAFHRDEAAVVALDKWERKHGYPASHSGFFTVNARVASKVLSAAGLEGPPTHWGGATIDPVVVGSAVAKVVKKFKSVLGELGITVRADVDKNPVHVVSAILAKMGLSVREKKSGGHRVYIVSSGDVAKMERVSARYLERLLDWDPAGKLLRDPVIAEMDAEWAPTPTGCLTPEMAQALIAEVLAA